MKIITLHKPVNITHLFNLLNQNLNPQFQKHKPTAYKFTVTENGNSVEITLPELYEGVLFHIEPVNDELHITRSEHYVDDINCLALESALNELFDELSGKRGTDLVQEG